MKIVHPELKHQIELKENIVNLLVVENPSFFYDLTSDFVGQCRDGIAGRLVLSQDNEIIPFEKKAAILLNPFELDINNKKLLSKLYSVLKEQVYSDELFLCTNNILTELELYLNQVAENVDFSLEYDAKVDIVGLFKLVGLKLQKEYTNKLEQLLDYLELLQHLLETKIMILVNFKVFFSQEELERLYDFAAHKKMQLILLESHMSENKIESEQVYIIDKFCCEIY